MRKQIIALLAAFSLLSGVAQAQDFLSYVSRFVSGETVAVTASADDASVALLIKYVGTEAFASVQVATTDLLFKTGASSPGVADASLTACGATAGTLDTANAACNTMGEMVDVINADPNWIAINVESLRTDLTAALTTLAASQNVQSANGLAITWDTTVHWEETRMLNAGRDDIRTFAPNGNALIGNPFFGRRVALFKWNATSTYASGTSTLQIISVEVDARNGAETATVVWSEAGGATTALKALDFSPYGLLGKHNGKVLIRILNSAAQSAVAIQAYGSEFADR